jgi:hypothetical protein
LTFDRIQQLPTKKPKEKINFSDARVAKVSKKNLNTL